MSVLKELRSESPIEYVRILDDAYSFSIDKVSVLPNRHSEFLKRPILMQLRLIEDYILEIFTLRRCSNYSEEYLETIDKAINAILDMRPLMLSYWAVRRTPFDKQCNWANKFNNLIISLLKLKGVNINNKTKKEKIFMYVLDYTCYSNAKFIKYMEELHTKIYSKSMSIQTELRLTDGNGMVDHSRKALFYMIDGNSNIPKNAKEYKERKEKFDKALFHLQEMEPMMASFFKRRRVSDNSIRQLSDLHTKTIKLLRSIIASDKKRFSKLI